MHLRDVRVRLDDNEAYGGHLLQSVNLRIRRHREVFCESDLVAEGRRWSLGGVVGRSLCSVTVVFLLHAPE